MFYRTDDITMFSDIVRIRWLQRTAVTAFSFHLQVWFVDMTKRRIIVSKQIHLGSAKRQVPFIPTVKKKDLVLHAPDTFPLYPDPTWELPLLIAEPGHRCPKLRKFYFHQTGS